MRIAALYDIHGNIDALEAVLAEVESAAPDLIVLGGDVVMGPFPAETMDRLLALRRPLEWVRGNTDRVVMAPERHPGDPWADRLGWIHEQLKPAHRARLTDLPTTLSHEVEGLGPVIFCHATPRSDDEIITPLTPEERLREVFAAVREPVVICGHIHLQYDRRAAGKRIVNAGSVGIPYQGEPGAYWVLLGPDVEHRRTVYDVARAAEHIQAGGMPRAGDFAQFLPAPPTAQEMSEKFERMASGARA